MKQSANPEAWTGRVRFYIDWLKGARLYPEDEELRARLLEQAELGPRSPDGITGKFHITIINLYNKYN